MTFSYNYCEMVYSSSRYLVIISKEGVEEIWGILESGLENEGAAEFFNLWECDKEESKLEDEGYSCSYSRSACLLVFKVSSWPIIILIKFYDSLFFSYSITSKLVNMAFLSLYLVSSLSALLNNIA